MAYRTTSDFAHFYATGLRSELNDLETLRKIVLGKVKVLIAVVIGIFVGIAAIGLSFDGARQAMVVAGFILTAGGSFVYRFLTSDYVHQYKLRVVKKIVAFIDPSLTYWPRRHISAVRFNSSRIFNRYPDRMRGDDMVEGKVGGTELAFSEVHAEYKTETSDGSGGRRRRYHTIFRGIFFIADFNKKFYGKTVVLPDTAEKLFGGMGSFLQKIGRPKDEFIKMDDPEFEKLFVVYADDQIEARYVLSPSLMKRIVDFSQKTGKRVYLSFVGSEVFVAIPYKQSLFEPRVFGKITGFKDVRRFFDDLQLALGIVEDLNLNTRIWTKRPSKPEGGDEQTPLGDNPVFRGPLSDILTKKPSSQE
jgi:type IV secretory pathway VirB2 component (pilin)